MLGLFGVSLPFLRIRIPPRSVQIEKIQFSRQEKNVGYRLTLETKFSWRAANRLMCQSE
jgi:hypothetical protein